MCQLLAKEYIQYPVDYTNNSNHKNETCITNEIQKFGIRNSGGCLGGDGVGEWPFHVMLQLHVKNTHLWSHWSEYLSKQIERTLE